MHRTFAFGSAVFLVLAAGASAALLRSDIPRRRSDKSCEHRFLHGALRAQCRAVGRCVGPCWTGL